MTNKSSSKQHGMHNVNSLRIKSKLRVRLRKAKTRVSQEARQEAIREARLSFFQKG